MDDLASLRMRIDEIDAQIFSLFEERMHISDKIAAVKRAEGRDVSDPAREQEKIEAAISSVPDDMGCDAMELMQLLMRASRNRQNARMKA